MERTADFAGLAFGIERTGLLERFRVERDDGVEFRANLIVGRDAREIERGEFLRSERTGGKSGIDVGHGGGRELKRRGANVGFGEAKNGQETEAEAADATGAK